MNIGELAKRTGASPRSLRYYEQRGMLESERTPGRWRNYSEDAVTRVTFIRLLLAAGVPTQTIVEILPCELTGHATPGMIELLTNEQERIEQNVTDLVSAKNRLAGVIDSARSSGLVESAVS